MLDANGRDTCAVDLKRTNTPLQALLLLNDETFVEHARGLAVRMLQANGDSDDVRIQRGMSLVLGRQAEDAEVSILREELQFQRRYFQSHPEAVKSFLAVGDSKPKESLDPVELATMTSVARVILNLDETLTKE